MYNYFYIFCSITITNYFLKVIQLHFNYFTKVCIINTIMKLPELTDNSWPRNMSNKNIKIDILFSNCCTKAKETKLIVN